MATRKIALVGNPNTGKTSLFNRLTGLNQHVGNYPGITVDKKTGTFSFRSVSYTLYDLPGTYSLYPNSGDEEIVFDVLADNTHPDHPDQVVVVGDPVNLRRSLLLFVQIRQLGIPAIFVMNMMDEAEKKGLHFQEEGLAAYLQAPVVFTNARKGDGIEQLKETIARPVPESLSLFFDIPAEYQSVVEKVQQEFNISRPYKAWQLLARKNSRFLDAEQSGRLDKIRNTYQIIPKRLQVKETLDIYKLTDKWSAQLRAGEENIYRSFTEKVDRILVHPVAGYVVFLGLLFLVFQAIFSWSSVPMDWIENGFVSITGTVRSVFPEGPLTDLLCDGIIAGIGGIVIFIPQIVLLFLFLLIMEESGYMSRVVFLMDRWMRPLGLSGKSVVPLMSGAACAVPAVMSARNIENPKERLITILVTPFMTCSARLPVYAIIISLVIPDGHWLIFSWKGIALMSMYLLGILAAVGSACIFHRIIRSPYKSYLIMEIPPYRFPYWKNVAVSLREKTGAFVFGAGKIILAISIVLWGLGSFGPGDFTTKATTQALADTLPDETSGQLEHSYLGIIGKAFEPVIRPLGYDWKMGIGIIASFAAREVFVPTMATIYSISENDEATDEEKKRKLEEKMQQETHPETGKPLYNTASGISLLLFYAFSMQCMSTFAAVRRETKSWKWAFIQLVFMTGMGYLTALAAYQVLQ